MQRITITLMTTCQAGAGIPDAVCANGVQDKVFHPVEPLALRLTLAGRF